MIPMHLDAKRGYILSTCAPTASLAFRRVQNDVPHSPTELIEHELKACERRNLRQCWYESTVEGSDSFSFIHFSKSVPHTVIRLHRRVSIALLLIEIIAVG